VKPPEYLVDIIDFLNYLSYSLDKNVVFISYLPDLKIEQNREKREEDLCLLI